MVKCSGSDLAAHKAELARRAAIVARLHDARVQRRHAEARMRHMAHLKAMADAALKIARKLHHEARTRLHNEKRLAHIARLKLELSIKNRRIADAQKRAAIRLSIAAKKRADRNAYLAGIAYGKWRSEHARKLRLIEKAKVAFAAAEIAKKTALKAIRERNIEIEIARKAHQARLLAERHARKEYHKWQLAVQITRRHLNIKIHTERRTHKIMLHQQHLTARAKMFFVRAQVARIAAVKRAVHAHKVWNHQRLVTFGQKVKQAAAEKLAAYWKAKRDAARKARDLAIAAKNKSYRDMKRDQHLYHVSIKAKNIAVGKWRAAEHLVVQWTSKVKSATKYWIHHVAERKKAKHAYFVMHLAMTKARRAADKMDALRKRAVGHYKSARHMLSITYKSYSSAVHSYKKSRAYWMSVHDKTKKHHARLQMKHRHAWMKKIHIKWTKAKKTMKGFKNNMAKWRARWMAAKHRMYRMKSKRHHAKLILGRVTILLGKAHKSLIKNRAFLKRMIAKKMHHMRIMIRARRHLSIQVHRTGKMKKFAHKQWAHMKRAIAFFQHNVKKMWIARRAAKIMGGRSRKAHVTLRNAYSSMMSWKAHQKRMHRREHLALLRKRAAIRAHKAAYAAYKLAIKARRHAYAKKQAAIRARRNAQLMAGGALKAQNRAEAKAAASVLRLARATRMMRRALYLKIKAEKRLIRQTKMRKHAERVAFHHHRQAIRRERRAHAMYKLRLSAQIILKKSLRKLRISIHAARVALKNKRMAWKHARKSMANDRRIIHSWSVKIVHATRLRMKAQRSARIAHSRYLHALKLKLIALRQAKRAHFLSRKAHKWMVHHRRIARIARRAMRMAYILMKKALSHKHAMIRLYRIKVKARKWAQKRYRIAFRLKIKAIKAYRLSVYHRKIAYHKRAAAIKRKLILIAQSRHAIKIATRAHFRANKMKKSMQVAWRILI
jgi:hypothetical protein